MKSDEWPWRARVIVSEASVGAFHGENALVGDRDSMGVTAEIVEDLFGTCDRGLGVHEPTDGLELGNHQAPGAVLGKIGARSRKVQLCAPPQASDLVEEFGGKDLRRGLDGSEKSRTLSGDRAAAVGIEATAGDEQVQVGMLAEFLAPGVQHRRHAGFGAQMRGVPRQTL
jgi:hypothetical protein